MLGTIESPDLVSFLEGLEIAATEHLIWRGGQIELDLTAYLTGKTPPPELTTSGRCIVLADDQVLLMTNPGGDHILPGGRVNPGEDVRTATIRELAEETGLEITDPELVAALVYQHTTPCPEIYRYPYPTFVNAVFLQRLPEPLPVTVNDTYELAGSFIPIAEAMGRLPRHQQVLLEAVTGHR